jgi:hypothetical protein
MLKITQFKTLLQLLLIIISTSVFSACGQIQASPDNDTIPYDIQPKDYENRKSKIQILNTLALKSVKVNSLPIIEISGIAFDNDENILYAISDEGMLYHIKLTLNKNKLQKLKVIYATQLKNKRGKVLKGSKSDSEGLSLTNANNGVKGDTKLIISFEGKPRISRFTTKGFKLAKIAIPKELSNKKNYRGKNKALESVVNHPKYGILTAAEFPLKKDGMKAQSVYSVSKFSPKKVWHFPASKADNSAITDMEVLPNGDLLIMERAFSNPFTPIVMNLSRLKLEQCDKKQNCKIEKIARLSSADGWRLDNFEGLTHIKGNQYLVVSDDNKNPLQETLFVLFELKP